MRLSFKPVVLAMIYGCYSVTVGTFFWVDQHAAGALAAAGQEPPASLVAHAGFTHTVFLTLLFGLGVAVAALTLLIYGFHNKISAILSRLNGVYTNLHSASDGMLNVADEIRASTSGQAAEVGQTHSAVTEISASAQSTVQSTVRLSASALQSKNIAEKSQKDVESILTDLAESVSKLATMGISINERLESVSQVVKMLAEIDTKTKVINDIVFQTRLLAFNAAIEASRAGEHGKGFSVVAEEIGSLAHMSGEAAREITTVLNATTERARAVIDETSQSIGKLVAEASSKINSSTDRAKGIGQSAKEITDSVRDLGKLIEDISAASSAQDAGLSTVRAALVQISDLAARSSETSLSSRAIAEELAEHAGEMGETLVQLENVFHGRKDDEPQPAAPVTDIGTRLRITRPADRKAA